MKLSLKAAWRAPLEAPGRLLLACAMLFAPLAGLVTIWLALFASASFVEPTPPVLVGVGLGSVAVLVWPLLLICGYLLRTVREADQGSQGLPPWNHWFSLTIDGLAVIVTGLLISLWPLLPVFLGSGLVLGFAGIPGMSDPKNDMAATMLSLFGSVVGVLCMLAFVVAILALTVLAPMAILRLARSNSVLAAANPFGVLADIFAGGVDYLVFWAMVLATYAAAHIALALLALLSMGILTPLLALLAPVVHVYLKLFSAQLLGQYGRAHLKHG